MGMDFDFIWGFSVKTFLQGMVSSMVLIPSGKVDSFFLPCYACRQFLFFLFEEKRKKKARA